MMYELVQNWDGPVIEDTEIPSEAIINDLMMLGELKVVDFEWKNSNEVGESYYLYHTLEILSEIQLRFQIILTPDGNLLKARLQRMGLLQSSTNTGASRHAKRMWYAVIIADSFGNINPTITRYWWKYVMVTEDTQAPEITYYIADEDGIPYLIIH